MWLPHVVFLIIDQMLVAASNLAFLHLRSSKHRSYCIGTGACPQELADIAVDGLRDSCGGKATLLLPRFRILYRPRSPPLVVGFTGIGLPRI